MHARVWKCFLPVSSVRVLPHHQDTGGFFVAVLHKSDWLPWQRTARQTSSGGPAPATTASCDETALRPSVLKEEGEVGERERGEGQEPRILMAETEVEGEGERGEGQEPRILMAETEVEGEGERGEGQEPRILMAETEVEGEGERGEGRILMAETKVEGEGERGEGREARILMAETEVEGEMEEKGKVKPTALVANREGEEGSGMQDGEGEEEVGDGGAHPSSKKTEETTNETADSNGRQGTTAANSRPGTAILGRFVG